MCGCQTRAKIALQPEFDETLVPLRKQLIHFGSHLDPQSQSYYANLTGFWKGETQFYNLTQLNASTRSTQGDVLPWIDQAKQFMVGANISNATEFTGRLGGWNWTRSNRVDLSFGDKLVRSRESKSEVSKDVAMIRVRLCLITSVLSSLTICRVRLISRIRIVRRSSDLNLTGYTSCQMVQFMPLLNLAGT